MPVWHGESASPAEGGYEEVTLVAFPKDTRYGLCQEVYDKA